MEKLGDFIKRYFTQDGKRELVVTDEVFAGIRSEMLKSREAGENPPPTLAELIARSKKTGPETPATELVAGQLIGAALPSTEDISGAASKPSQGFESPGSTTEIQSGYAVSMLTPTGVQMSALQGDIERCERELRAAFRENDIARADRWKARLNEASVALAQYMQQRRRREKTRQAATSSDNTLTYDKLKLTIADVEAAIMSGNSVYQQQLQRQMQSLIADGANAMDVEIMGRRAGKTDRQQASRPNQPVTWVVSGSRAAAQEWIVGQIVSDGYIYEALSTESLRALPTTFRGGDRIALVEDWYTLTDALGWLAVMFQTLNPKEPARGTIKSRPTTRSDVQVWSVQPLPPLRIDLGPRAKDIKFQQICQDCGKPAFTHKYKNDPADIYGNRGIWECLPIDATRDGWKEEGRNYAQAFVDDWNTPGTAGAFPSAGRPPFAAGALRRSDVKPRRPMADAAKPKPAAPAPLTRTQRQYDDDF